MGQPIQQVIFELNVDGAHPVKGRVCRRASASFRPPLRLDREPGRTTLWQARAYLGKPCPICSGAAKPLPTVTPKADDLLAKAKAGVEARKKLAAFNKFAENAGKDMGSAADFMEDAKKNVEWYKKLKGIEDDPA